MPKSTNAEIYEKAERELIGEAIAETEEEIARAAFDEEPDENTGDRSLEEMDDEGLDDDVREEDEGQDEGEGEDEGDEGDEETGEDQEGELDPERLSKDRAGDRGQDDPGLVRGRDDRRGVPSQRLRQESDARRAAEAEREAERQRVRALEAEVAALKRQPRQDQPKEPDKPDLFADPDGFMRQQRAEWEGQQNQRLAAASFEDAAEEHGAEAFDQAFRGLFEGCQRGDPVALATAQKMGQAPMRAGRILMKHAADQQIRSEIGNDPQAYRQKVLREALDDPEIRRELLDGLRDNAERGDRGRARTRTRIPQSLNGASGGTGHRGRDPGRDPYRTTKSLEDEIAASAWEN